MENFQPFKLGIILKNAAKSNFNRGILSRKFYHNLVLRLYNGGYLNCNNMTVVSELLYVLTAARALTIN